MLARPRSTRASFAAPAPPPTDARARELFARFGEALDGGEVRAAEPDPSIALGWRVNPWVKQGILLGFRFGRIVDLSVGAADGRACPSSTRTRYR